MMPPTHTDTEESCPLFRVAETVRTMVGAGGCAWHAEQTHASLTKYLVEETAELIDAIERSLPVEELRSELGDVLYQVLFHAAIAERDGEGYSLMSVAEALNEKLRARHPHVFGDRGRMSAQQLCEEWEHLKEEAAGLERGSRNPLEGIPAAMPTLSRAAKVVDRLTRAGLLATAHPHTSDEADSCVPAAGARGAQLPATGHPATPADPEYDLGEQLLELVKHAQAQHLDPDRALRRAVDRLSEQLVGGGHGREVDRMNVCDPT